VPSSDDAPGGFILDSLRPHVIKGTLVYQTVFVHSSDTSDVVSVFQSAKPEFSKLVKQHFDKADVNIVVEERHDVILLIIGNYDDETLRKFAALFERNDERAINLLEADAEALNSLG
jgi:hypothetical protein